MAVVSLLLFGGLWSAVGSSNLGVVTCGSVVKLLNTRHNVRLHSHDVRYGSGSGQQSVTGVTSVDDSNSYWRIRGKTATVCERGTPIRCGQPIRLTHVNTGRNLHSHHFTSPLSGNQVRCILWAMAALQNITQLSCLKSWFLSPFFPGVSVPFCADLENCLCLISVKEIVSGQNGETTCRSNQKTSRKK